MAWNQAPYSFNQNTNRGNATANANPRYLMSGSASGTGFIYYDQDLNLVNNDQFGTCTLDSLDPLTITYTINEGVTWSDGRPGRRRRPAHRVGRPERRVQRRRHGGHRHRRDGPGRRERLGHRRRSRRRRHHVGRRGRYAAAFDPETGALLEGYTYKASTGVNFDSASESLAAGHAVPGDLRGRAVADGDVGHVLRRLRRPPVCSRASRRTSSARTPSASKIRWRPRRR